MIDIERLAREAGLEEAVGGLFYASNDGLQRFAALVRNEVLEEAAKCCDEAADSLDSGKRTNQVDRHTADVLRRRSAAIRALKDKK
jgi:hypothetical protein